MFRLEKVFQNDDNIFIYSTNFVKVLLVFINCYVFSILIDNSIFEIFNYEIFTNSNYYFFSITISISYFIFSFFLIKKNDYKKNFLSFIKVDIFNILLSTIFTIFLIFILKINFKIEIILIYLLVYLIIILGIFKLYSNFIYQNLIDKNIIQKNIMLIGNYHEIKKIIDEKFDKIFVFKCCILLDTKNINLKIVKSEFKFPIFNLDEDIRSILEYHSLGQIWILNGDKNKLKILSNIFKFSVDTLNIKLEQNFNIKGKKLLANKFDYDFYEKSRFYGLSLFIKILIDKILSILFLILASPILVLSSLFIFFEDGLPILFTQNRTGWDGRRFKIYKLRSLKKFNFDKTLQVSKDDRRLLKIGKIVRRFSIDEIPQFFNVLSGDMSIVGPRPHMVEHDIYYSNMFNQFLKRHKCNPGITGWAQVNGLRGATPKPELMKRRMEYDLWYLSNWTIWLDLYIIFKTFYAVIKYRGN